ncbi:MAG TPA: response regulator [Nannocystis exedens]|nr:response regulator [Nannocystis exedens]
MNVSRDNNRRSVLVVDDSPPMRKMIVFALSRLPGLDLVEADDGVDALRKLAGATFDLIITDLNMPILDGLKLVKRLRADKRYERVPIIIITTEGAAEDRQRALALGANAYITKPIRAREVIKLVRQILEKETP